MNVRLTPARIVTLAVATILPLAVLGVLLAGLWSPTDRLDRVRAAIVNEDEPVEIEDQTLPLGRELAGGLVDGGDGEVGDTNYTWEVTSADRAAEGLEDGTFHAVVTIPENFSAAATSILVDEEWPRQATIDVTTPPGGRVLDEALARIISTTALDVLGETLTETYVDNLLLGFSTLATELAEAADGADQLAEGNAEAGEAAEALAEGGEGLAGGARDSASAAYQLADGAGELGAGAAELGGGARELGGGLDELAGGAGELAGGARQLAGGAGELAGGAGELAGGAGELAGGLGELAGGAEELAAGMAALDQDVALLPPAATDLAAGAQQVADGIGAFVPDPAAILEAVGCGSAPPQLPGGPELPPPSAEDCEQIAALLEENLESIFAPVIELQDGADQVASGMAAFAGVPPAQGGPTGLYELSAGVSGLSAGVGELAGAAGQLPPAAGALAGGAEEIAGGASELSTGLEGLATGIDGVAGGAGESAGAARQIAGGAQELAGGAGELADGGQQLGGGLGELGTGAEEIAEGNSELAGGLGELAEGNAELGSGLRDATGELPNYGDEERAEIADVAASPASGPGIDGLTGASTGALFAILSLWLGALMLLLVLPPVPPGALGSTRSAAELALRALALPVALGAAGGAGVGILLSAVEGLSPARWVGVIGICVLIAVCFVAVNQALAAAFGNAGRCAGVLVAVVALATGVVATAPGWLVLISNVLPVGPARQALLTAVIPAASGWLFALVVLVFWTAAGIGLSTLAIARRRVLRPRQVLALAAA